MNKPVGLQAGRQEVRQPQQGGGRACEEPRASGVQVWQEEHLGLEALHDALEG